MNKRISLKKSSAAVLMMVLLAILLQTSIVNSATPTASEKSLTFVEDVAGLNLAKYKVQLVMNNKTSPSDSRSFAIESVLYKLESTDSKLEIACDFIGNTLTWCKIYRIAGSPLFARPPIASVGGVKSLLGRYQTHSDVSYLQPMQDTLNTITEIHPLTKTVGNTRLEITKTAGKDTITSFVWTDAPAHITNTYKVLVLRLRNGAFESITNWWDIYNIGNFDVKVDKENAVQIAKEQAKKCSWSDGKNVLSNVTFADEPEAVLTELRMQPRDGNTLYPQWEICLGLDYIHAGGITQIDVLLWADTGEIATILPSSYYGVVPSDMTPTQPPSDQSQQPPSSPLPEQSQKTNSGDNLLMNTSVIIAVASVIAIPVLLAVFIKRRKK